MEGDGWAYGDSETGASVIGERLGLAKAALTFSGWVDRDGDQSLGAHVMNLGGVVLADGFRVEIQVLVLVFVFDGNHGVSSITVAVDESQTVFKRVATASAVEVVLYGVAEYLFVAFFADRALYIEELGETGGTDEGVFRKDDLVANEAAAGVEGVEDGVQDAGNELKWQLE